MTTDPISPLSAGDVAQIFGVDPKTVNRWAAHGKLPAFKTPGGHWRFHWSAVSAFLPSHAEGGTR